MAIPRLSTQRVAPAQRPSTLGPVPGQEVAAATGALAQATAIFAKEVQRIDDLRVSEAELDYRNRIRTAYEDPKDGFTAKRGTDAIAGLDGFRDRLRSAASEVEANLTSETQRMLFRRRAAQLQADADAQAGRYVRQETEREQVETYTALTEADMKAIADNPLNADSLIRAMDERTAIFGDNMGRAPDAIAQDRAKVRSAARLAQVEALAASDPSRAKQVLDAVIGEIAPDQRERAREFVNAADLTARALRVSDDLLSAFPNDEAAAIREAERTYEGKEREFIVNRIEVAYARQRRLRQEEIGKYTEDAMSAAYSGRSVPRETAAWLEANDQGKVLRAAQEVQRAVVKGEPVETNLATYQELSQMLLPENRARFLETNLLQYADRVSRQHLTEFMDAQTAFRGGTTRPGAAVATSSVMTELFKQAQGSRMFDAAVVNLGDLETRPAEKAIYETLQQAVNAEIATYRDEKKAEPNRTQVQQIIRETLDKYIIEDQGEGLWRFGGRVAVPRTSVPRDAQIRASLEQRGFTVTAAKVAAIRLLDGRTDLTPEQKRAEANRIAREP